MLLKVLQVFLLSLCLIALVGCKGDEGPTGPQGPAGADGQDGNANIIMFEYGSQTSSFGSLHYVFEASQGLIDSSLVLAYCQSTTPGSTTWYAIPGLGFDGLYMARSYWQQTNISPSEYTYRVRLRTTDGTAAYGTDVTFEKFRIFLAPASSITAGAKSGTLNIADYRSVQEYFNLPE